MACSDSCHCQLTLEKTRTWFTLLSASSNSNLISFLGIPRCQCPGVLKRQMEQGRLWAAMHHDVDSLCIPFPQGLVNLNGRCHNQGPSRSQAEVCVKCWLGMGSPSIYPAEEAAQILRAAGFRWMASVWARSGVWASKGIFSAKRKGAANCCMGESLGEVLFHEFKATLAT